jgi:dihydrofolate reductase
MSTIVLDISISIDGFVAGPNDGRANGLGEGLIDELRLHIAPVILGAGTRLFDAGGIGPIALERLRVA